TSTRTSCGASPGPRPAAAPRPPAGRRWVTPGNAGRSGIPPSPPEAGERGVVFLPSPPASGGEGPGVRGVRPRRVRVSEIGVDDVPVVAAGQPADGVDVAALAEEPDRPVAEPEERPARVPAAERLRGRPVDPGRVLVHPPHHVADVDGAAPFPGH